MITESDISSKATEYEKYAGFDYDSFVVGAKWAMKRMSPEVCDVCKKEPDCLFITEHGKFCKNHKETVITR